MAHPASHCVVTEGSFPGIKRLGREVEQSCPSGVEVKSEWSCTSCPVCLHGTHRNTFIFITCGKRLATQELLFFTKLVDISLCSFFLHLRSYIYSQT